MSSCNLSERFGGIQRLYGALAEEIFQNAHVCVVGIGGVGSWAVEALARSGIGAITLIDYDDIAESNINRQLHTLTDTLGRKKVDVMAERVRQINPECRCHAIDDFLTLQNYEAYLARGYHYVIDAIDSIKFKSLMINHCKRHKIPIIATGGAGGLTDPTQIRIDDISRTYNDALISKVRAQLRKEYGFPKDVKKRFGVECVFSTQQPVYPKPDGSVSHQKPGIHGVSLDCRFGYGASSCVTSVFGFAAVSRVLEKLVGTGRPA